MASLLLPRGPLPRTRALAALALLAGLAACRCPRLPRPPPATADGARSAPGPYAGDARVRALIDDWPLRVGEALDRLTLVTGLSFGEVAPEVALVALRDEGRAFEIRTRIVDGVRVPLLRVNLERLAAGIEDPDEVLARALAGAALEYAARRSGSVVPPWLLEAAGAAAGGVLAERVERLVRDDVLEGREPAARVDPLAARANASTGLAVVLLLLERGGPDMVRRFFDAVAEGDPAEEALGRLLRDGPTLWAAVRRALDDRLAAIDPAPWRLLVRADEALAETGRAGLLAVLEAGRSDVVADDLAVLAARAALAEGDVDAARAALRALGPDAPRRLRRPLEAALLRLRVEAAPGGDPVLAADLLERLARDFPRTGEADRWGAEWRVGQTGEGGLAALRRRVETEGLEALDLATAVRYVGLLHLEHRDGAAGRALVALGERGTAAELAPLAQAVAEAEQRPSAAALAAARARVDAWRAAPDAGTRRDVVETGSAAARALEETLPGEVGSVRATEVALLGEVGGAGVVGALAASWREDPRRLAPDLEALAASVRLPELEVWMRSAAPERLDPEASARLFDALRLDLDAAWVREHPDETWLLRSSDVAVRRAAFGRAVAEGQAVRAPSLVARFLADPAPGLRREAVRTAGAAGFEALVRAAADDPSPWVRREACAALARGRDPASIAVLRARLASDPAPSVRAAAAPALAEAAPDERGTVEALAAALREEDAGVRRVVTAALAGVPRERLKEPLLAALRGECGRAEPRGEVLHSLFYLLEEVVGLDLGYYLGMPVDEIRRLVERLQRPPSPRPGR